MTEKMFETRTVYYENMEDDLEILPVIKYEVHATDKPFELYARFDTPFAKERIDAGEDTGTYRILITAHGDGDTPQVTDHTIELPLHLKDATNQAYVATFRRMYISMVDTAIQQVFALSEIQFAAIKSMRETLGLDKDETDVA